jgi:hypothetical protein
MFVTFPKADQFVYHPFFLVSCSDDPVFPQEIEEVSSQILAAEEVLLEALCFDFVVESPHADLVDLFDAHGVGDHFQDYAWSIAHDSSVSSTPAICTHCDVFGSQVPHTPLRTFPTEDHRYCLLCSLSTDC